MVVIVFVGFFLRLFYRESFIIIYYYKFYIKILLYIVYYTIRYIFIFFKSRLAIKIELSQSIKIHKGLFN